MPTKRNTKLGKIRPYVDVREETQVPEFESMIKTGPVIVLVYADWCGHCQTFKRNMWDDVASMENKSMNTAAVHYNMVDKTSLKNASIKGYPTLIKVSPTPKANTTNVLKTPQQKTELETLVGVETEEEPGVVNMTNTMSMVNEATVNEPVVNETETMPVKRATNLSPMKNSFTPVASSALPPPDPSLDAVTTLVESQRTNGTMKGGNLMGSLVKVIEDAGHVVLLAASAAELHKRFGKKHRHTRKSRHAKRKTNRRRR
jgi:thiol-disulfide isomerase/thioredoxin